MKKIIKAVTFSITGIILFAILGTFTINLYMYFYSRPYIYHNIDEMPENYTVIVPGARVYKNNVSFVVRDRLNAASICIKNEKAQRILLSGDHGQKDYDEVNRMKEFLENIYRINPDIIFMDHAGFSTYETMYRARDVFCVKDAVIVTQKFHTYRAVYIGRKLGLNVFAFESPELNPFNKKVHLSWSCREILARVKSFFLVLFNVKPTFLGNKIPITGNAKETWD